MKRLLVLLLPLIFTLSSIAQGQGRDGTSGVAAATIRGTASNPAGVSCAPESTGAVAVRVYSGGFYICSGGVYVAVSGGGGGTTINSTNGQLPYRVNSTTFGDSAFASNALNSTYLSATSGASGAGVTLTVTGGGTNENLTLTPKGTGVIEQRNGTNAQTFRVYNTYTDASNYTRLEITSDGSTFYLGTFNAGTGTARTLGLVTGSAVRWSISTSGHLLAHTDNTYDIGASGATRPRNVYVAGNTQTGGGFYSDGATTSDGVGFIANSEGVAMLRDYAGTSFNRLQFGGTSSSFPALKRSSAALEVRVADDTAYAAHRALTYGVNNACVIRSGAGSPESAVTGNVCDLYLRTDGGANTTLYIKESGTGNTGWVAK